MSEKKTLFLGFVGPSYSAQEGRFERQRSINMYLESDPTGMAKDQQNAMLTSIPGIKSIMNIGTGPIRCLYVPPSNPNLLYIVSGNEVYIADNSLTSATALTGTMLTTSGPVKMVDNGIDVMWVDGASGYWNSMDPTDTEIHQIISPNFYPASTISFQDGYFILNQEGTIYYFISDLYSHDFLPLNTAGKTGSTDNTIGIVSNNRELYLFGSQTVEVWADTGASGSTPFARNQPGLFSYGCVAPESIQRIDNSVLWLGKNQDGQGMVFLLAGDLPQRVSNNALEYHIAQYGDLSGAVAWSYQEYGHTFYLLNIPGADTTWCYDVLTQQWHERQSNINGYVSQNIRQTHAFYLNTHVVGDSRSTAGGILYEQSYKYFDEDGQPLVRTRQSAHIAKNLNNVFYKLLEVDFKVGVGLNNDGVNPTNAVNPQAILETSNDGGESWSNRSYASLGKIGQTFARARWNRLGRARDRIFRVSVSDPVHVAMISAHLDLEEGTG